MNQKVEIRQALATIKACANHFLSEGLKSQFEKIENQIQVSFLNDYSPEKNKESLTFVWKSTEAFEKSVKAFLNDELVKQWSLIYEYVKNLAGNVIVEQENRRVQDKKDEEVVSEIGNAYDLSVVWSMEYPRDACQQIDFNKKVPFNWRFLAYTTSSGWGTPNKVKLPDNATYLDVWKAADSLVKKSGDSHHIFLEGIVQEKFSECEFYISLGS